MDSNYLERKHIRALLVDDPFVWAETTDGEFVKIDYVNRKLKIYQHRPPSMVNTYFYHSIFKAPDGKLYLGGRYMGLLQFDPIKETFRNFLPDPNSRDKKRDDDVAVYFVDSKVNYWVSGIDGHYFFDLNNEVF